MEGRERQSQLKQKKMKERDKNSKTKNMEERKSQEEIRHVDRKKWVRQTLFKYNKRKEIIGKKLSTYL